MADFPEFINLSGLFGMISAPESGVEAKRTAAIILNAGTINNVGPYRMSFDLAKSLSRHGFPVLRLDQTGKGESFDAQRLETDSMSLIRDLKSAQSVLRQRFDVDDFHLIGLCSGAVHAMEGATRLDQIRGIAMFDGWAPRTAKYFWTRFSPKLRHPLKLPKLVWGLYRKFSAKKTENEAFLGEILGTHRVWNEAEMWSYIRILTCQKLPILAVYTADACDYYLYPEQLRHALTMKKLDYGFITEVYKPKCKHLFPIALHREQLVKEVTDWVCEYS